MKILKTYFKIKFFLKTFRIISDAFSITFLYANRYDIILRFFNDQNLKQRGTKHALQRWIHCINQHFLSNMMPALLFMYEQHRPEWDRTLGDFDRDLIDERVEIAKNAEILSKEAVEEYKKRFLEQIEAKIPANIAVDVYNKLKNLKIVISLQKSIFPIGKFKEFYKNLNLNGEENFLKSIWEFQKHHKKIQNEPNSSWRKQIDRLVNEGKGDLCRYEIGNGNILCKCFKIFG